MLGLWSIGTMSIGLTLHIAFNVDLKDLLDAPRHLRLNGITPLSFFGEETNEPSVLCWMPAASIFFRDPDGHLIEYLAMLDAESNPYLGIIPWNKWLAGKELIMKDKKYYTKVFEEEEEETISYISRILQ
jgi:lactoylglutathione lyase